MSRFKRELVLEFLFSENSKVLLTSECNILILRIFSLQLTMKIKYKVRSIMLGNISVESRYASYEVNHNFAIDFKLKFYSWNFYQNSIVPKMKYKRMYSQQHENKFANRFQVLSVLWFNTIVKYNIKRSSKQCELQLFWCESNFFLNQIIYICILFL